MENVFTVDVLLGNELKIADFDDLQTALDVYLAAYKVAKSLNMRARGSLLKHINDNGSDDYVSIAKFFTDEEKKG